MLKRSEKKSIRYVLRDLVIANGGIMNIVPDVLRSHSFKGWDARQIRGIVFQLRQEFTDGEVWCLFKGCIYQKEDQLPPAIWKEICDRKANKISGVADQNRIYETKYKKVRPEEEVIKGLDSNIKVLGQTMKSSLKLTNILDEADP